MTAKAAPTLQPMLSRDVREARRLDRAAVEH